MGGRLLLPCAGGRRLMSRRLLLCGGRLHVRGRLLRRRRLHMCGRLLLACAGRRSLMSRRLLRGRRGDVGGRLRLGDRRMRRGRRLLRGRSLRMRRLLPGARMRLRLLRGRRLDVRRLLGLRRRRFRGGRRRWRRGLLGRRCFRLRLTLFLLLRRFRLLLLCENHRAVVACGRRDRLAQRKRRDDRSGEQQLFRHRHLGLVLRFVRLARLGARETTGGRQWCVLILTK
jgi:hypothetical protein